MAPPFSLCLKAPHAELGTVITGAAAMPAFDAPYSMTLREIDGAGMYDSAVEETGKVFVSTALRGGGTATARSIGIARRGVISLLEHAGIVEGKPEIGPGIEIDTTVGNCFHFTEESGLIRPTVDLGGKVPAGAPIARIWPLGRSGTAAFIADAQRQGILAVRHFPGLTETGDCLAVVAALHGQGASRSDSTASGQSSCPCILHGQSRRSGQIGCSATCPIRVTLAPVG